MMPFETVEGELKVLVYRGGDDAKSGRGAQKDLKEVSRLMHVVGLLSIQVVALGFFLFLPKIGW
jgi:hypothetical protein